MQKGVHCFSGTEDGEAFNVKKRMLLLARAPETATVQRMAKVPGIASVVGVASVAGIASIPGIANVPGIAGVPKFDGWLGGTGKIWIFGRFLLKMH